MAEKLKDRFFTHDSIRTTAGIIHAIYNHFDVTAFQEEILTEAFMDMELMDKMHHTTRCLKRFLPQSFPEAIDILKKVAPKVTSAEGMCFPDYVEQYGLEHEPIALDALAWFTKFSSSEFAIRPFILKNPETVMAFLLKLTQHEDPKVRRFASEGCRPRLPWSMSLPIFKKDPTLIFPILENLKDDPSEFVRKSVANNLNDISKEHPDLVLEKGKKWIGKSKQTDWIVKHACRSLLKAGNPQAMLLFGFSDPRDMSVSNLKAQPTNLQIGSELQFRFALNVKKTGKVRIEYRVHYVKAKGRTSQKIFKISEKTVHVGTHAISRKQAFSDLSTRKHYPGQHLIEVVINGVSMAQTAFNLTGP